jgi:hypothetical protein
MNKTIRLIRNFLIFPLGVPILVLFAYEPGWAANHYVRAAAAGSADGSDWTNACTDFIGSCAVSSLVRGDTYYVATGSYAARTFNTAVSGTLVLTIKGATAADHGTATGWNNAYGVDVAQAHWAYQLVIDSSYWVFDGTTPITPLSNNSLAYGFIVDKPSPCSTAVNGQLRVDLGSASLSHVTIKHTALIACGSDFDIRQKVLTVGCGECTDSDITISTVYIQNGVNNLQFSSVTDSLVEYVYSNRNWSSSANHGAGFVIQRTSGITVRNSIWASARGTAAFDVLNGNNHDMDGWAIYGNLFIDKSDGSNGVIAIGDSTTAIANTVIYNNTVVNCSPTTFFRQCEATSGCTLAAGNVVKNNLFYNSNGNILQDDGGVIDHDYNSFLSGINPPTERHGQIASFQPFANYAGGDYRLSSSGATLLTPGLRLAAPYNTDPLGKTRGADGIWDSGAFEFVGTNKPPSPPIGLKIF